MVESFRGRPYAERHLQAIVSFARANNPFYRRWITDPENPGIVDRMTFLEHNDEILAGHPVTGSTSGSTGVPVRFSQSPEWGRIARRDTVRFVRQLGGPMSVVRLIYVEKEPEPNTFSITSSLDEQIAFVLRRHTDHGATALTTYPTNAEMLAEAVLARGVDMSFIRRFGLYGESVEPFYKEIIRKAFPNARVWTTYSSMEFAMIASMCPYEPEYHHINAHRLGVEVLREDGSPASDGECGRVVVTDYVNRQSPFIRYEIGDYAVRGACPCGRIRLPAFRHIYGKVRGALLHRNGNRVLFADLSVSLRSMPGMRQYQVIQDAVDEFTVKVVADRNLDADIRAAFLEHFGYLPLDLRVEYVNLIPREKNGKFHAAICRA